MKKKMFALMMAAVMVFSLAACGSSGSSSSTDEAEEETEEEEDEAEEAEETEEAAEEETEDSDIAYIQEKGTLIVGITDFAPMDYLDDDGEWIGLDADLARIVAEDLGVEIEFIEIDWDNKILELDNKSIDVVWNGMTLTDEVATAMNCTEAYCNNAQVVVMAADAIDEFTDADSLSGLTFAVESGSAGEAAAEEYGFDYTSVLAQSDALLEVASGSSDAAIIDITMAYAMTGEGTSYEDLTYSLELTTEEYVVGCRVGSDLTDFINEEFAALYADGTLMEIAATYEMEGAIVEW